MPWHVVGGAHLVLLLLVLLSSTEHVKHTATARSQTDTLSDSPQQLQQLTTETLNGRLQCRRETKTLPHHA